MNLTEQFILKNVVKENHVGWKIDELTFDILSPNDIVKYSSVRVTHPGFYQPTAGGALRPLPHGPMDLHMGANRADRDKNVGRCQTCEGTWDDCVGHWGYVQLPYPVFHPGFFKHAISILYCVCKTCGSLLLPDDRKDSYLRRMRRHASDNIMKMRVFKSLVDESKKIDICRFCEASQGMLRRTNQGTPDKFMKLQHEIKTKEANGRVAKIIQDLDATTVYRIFSKIPQTDREVLFVQKPENLLISVFPVPPSSIRPSITLGDAGTNEDDLTAAIKDIIQLSEQIQNTSDTGQNMTLIASQLEALQLNAVRFINTDYPQLEAALNALASTGSGGGAGGVKIGRGVAQRLKGKEGRFRCNLSGKRVDFSGRTVISPDPNCPIPCVIVPMWSAMRLTFPDRVTAFNVEKLRECVIRGPDEWPGALSITRKSEDFRTSLKYVNRRQIAASLQPGDLVERHLQEDDMVLFNRQPSLHRMSIMAHRARVMPWRTLRFNECVCSPYNADFDGDEMNCHLPQTLEAKAEALHLMGVVNNLTTPKNGEPLIAATQDFLSGSFMITHKDVFLTRDRFALFCAYFSDGLIQIDIPPPCLIKPMELWTGKQLYNLVIRPNRTAKVIVNFDLKERDFQKPKNPGDLPCMCLHDGYISFRKSELMCGTLGKKVLGGGSKEGLFFHLIRDNNPAIAAEIMVRVAKLTGRWFANRGMTIGIDDVTPSPIITELKRVMLDDGFAKVDDLVEAYRTGRMLPDPGSTLEQTLENRSKAVLDDLRTKGGELSIEKLHPLNKPLLMFLSGAKGALINMAQMICLVGQQNVNGKRIWDGFVRRTLPHYAPDKVLSPKAKGFVGNSFYTGLTPDEFFFHTMSGREGLVDTAVKTADTGYMQRRLVKALEDLSVKYDRTVRTSDGQVVQFVYGDDGLNPQLMEKKTDLVDLNGTFVHIRSLRRLQPELLDANCQVEMNGLEARGYGVDMKLKNSAKKRRSPDDTEPMDPAHVEPEDLDVILPPSSLHKALAYAREHLNKPSSKFFSGMPRALRQKVELLGQICCRLGGNHVSELWRNELPAYAAPERRVIEQIRTHVAAYIITSFQTGPSTKALAPLLPYEFLQWAEWLLPRMREIEPPTVTVGEQAARREDPTHQKKTERLRVFGEEVWRWCIDQADKMAKVRLQNGENAALTKEEYELTVRLYREDASIDRLALKNYHACSTIHPLQRRLWYHKKGAQIFRDFSKRNSEDAETAIRAAASIEPSPQVSLLMQDTTEENLNSAVIASRISERWKVSSWVTLPQLYDLCVLLWQKYNKALIEPGEAVGAIGAQSIGEPGTQMTLKTFHFAGVASMNVTLGVPRIKEIINAASKIGTPILTVPLALNKNSFSYAQMIKGQLQCIRLGQVARYFKQVISPEGAWVVVRLSKEAIQNNFLEVTADVVREKILEAGSVGKLKIRENLIEIVHKYKLTVRPPGGREGVSGLSFQLTALMDGLPEVPVSGMTNVRRCIVQTKAVGDQNEYSLAVEGEGFRAIMSVEGVEGNRVGCNNVIEVKDVLGIEAARQVIISEIKGCMDAYSMDIDIRHMLLLGDVMTFRGEVLGISRHGIQKMRASVLCLASFEETNEHLFEAAVHRKSEHVKGVSEAIILGSRVSVGTGSFDVLQNPKGLLSMELPADEPSLLKRTKLLRAQLLKESATLEEAAKQMNEQPAPESEPSAQIPSAESYSLASNLPENQPAVSDLGDFPILNEPSAAGEEPPTDPQSLMAAPVAPARKTRRMVPKRGAKR